MIPLFQGRPYRERPPSAPFDPPTRRGQDLVKKYHLEDWASNYARTTAEEALGYLDLLDRVPDFFKGAVEVLDVGVKNWRSLLALTSAHELQNSEAASKFYGVELDAYRTYRDLTTRASVAKYYAEKLSRAKRSCQFFAQDARSWDRPVDRIVHLFPFLSLSTHRAWRLRAGEYDPPGLFCHLARNLKPGGQLLMANQGEWEWSEARSVMRKIPLRLKQEHWIEGSLHPSSYPIIVSRWELG